MQTDNYFIIESPDSDCLMDLQIWLSDEFRTEMLPPSPEERLSLGGGDSKIKVFFDSVKKVIAAVKEWLINYGSCVITFVNGEKKAEIRLPAHRISDDQLDAILYELNGFFDNVEDSADEKVEEITG